MPHQDEPTLVKVELADEDGDVETPWASPLGNNLYRLENSPFFVNGISWEDVIEAKPDEEGVLVFVRLIEKSGNRTVRAVLNPQNTEVAEVGAVLQSLERLGCSWESVGSVFCINIPAKVDFDAVCEFLIDTSVEWEYADPSPEAM